MSTEATETEIRLPTWPPSIPQFTGTRTPTPATKTDLPHVPAELQNWVTQFERAQISATRYASPNLIAQLRQVGRESIDTVICNLLDGDYALRLNASLGAQFATEIATALRMLVDSTGAARGWIVTDATTPNPWLNTLRREARSKRLRVLGLRNEYPQSDPTLLLYTLTGARLKPGRLPTEQGAVLLDGAAAVAIGDFLLSSHAYTAAPVAVHDHLSRKSLYSWIPIGTTLADLLGRLNIIPNGNIIRIADPLRDLRATFDTPLGTGELIIHVMPAEPPINPDPCIRCAWCVEGCPTRIQPAGLLEAAQYNNPAMAEKNGIYACIECGICSYVCPSKLPLLPSIRRMKKSMALTTETT